MPAWTRQQLEEILVKNNKRFVGMKLQACDFSGMDLEKADFRSASLPYADFTGANCRFANFEGANLTFSKWDNANCHRANFKDAILCDVDMRGVTDFFGVTVTMECRSFNGLKLPAGFWWGFLFYGLLMEPPSEEARERLVVCMGAERFKVLSEQYAVRRM